MGLPEQGNATCESANELGYQVKVEGQPGYIFLKTSTVIANHAAPHVAAI
jgi:hypothetical protein